jgi:hypothetical protein
VFRDLRLRAVLCLPERSSKNAGIDLERIGFTVTCKQSKSLRIGGMTMASLKTFLEKYSISTHTLASGFATLVLLYAAVPAFHDLVFKVYSLMPSWAHEVVTALLAVYAFYHGAQKPSEGV